jgi:hypothetical protein
MASDSGLSGSGFEGYPINLGDDHLAIMLESQDLHPLSDSVDLPLSTQTSNTIPDDLV